MDLEGTQWFTLIIFGLGVVSLLYAFGEESSTNDLINGCSEHYSENGDADQYKKCSDGAIDNLNLSIKLKSAGFIMALSGIFLEVWKKNWD